MICFTEIKTIKKKPNGNSEKHSDWKHSDWREKKKKSRVWTDLIKHKEESVSSKTEYLKFSSQKSKRKIDLKRS